MSNPLSAYPLSKIDGLGVHAQARLKAEGIRTTAALLESASTPKGRKALAARTGLSEQQLLAWANIADCMRIKGMGKAKAEVGKKNPARDVWPGFGLACRGGIRTRP